MYPKIPMKPESVTSKEVTEKDIVESFNKVDRTKIYAIANEIFSPYGNNGFSTIEVEVSSGYPVAIAVVPATSPSALKIIINPTEIKNQVNEVRSKTNIDLDLDDFMLSAFAHEVSHAHGKYDFDMSKEIKEIQVGFDFRISVEIPVEEVKLVKDLSGMVDLLSKYALYSGTLINESFTDFNAYKIFQKYFSEDADKHIFYPGYANLARLLDVFLDFFANAFDVKYSWTTREGIENILMRHYVSGQMILDHSDIYASVKPEYLEILKEIFASGQKESFDLELPKKLTAKMVEILRKDGARKYQNEQV